MGNIPLPTTKTGKNKNDDQGISIYPTCKNAIPGTIPLPTTKIAKNKNDDQGISIYTLSPRISSSNFLGITFEKNNLIVKASLKTNRIRISQISQIRLIIRLP